MSDPTPEEILTVTAKLSDGEWKGFTERETNVAKWIVGWDDDIIPEADGVTGSIEPVPIGIAEGFGKDMDHE